jgi:hypothetical protein
MASNRKGGHKLQELGQHRAIKHKNNFMSNAGIKPNIFEVYAKELVDGRRDNGADDKADKKFRQFHGIFPCYF